MRGDPAVSPMEIRGFASSPRSDFALSALDGLVMERWHYNHASPTLKRGKMAEVRLFIVYALIAASFAPAAMRQAPARRSKSGACLP
jgi:hypothetical protein